MLANAFAGCDSTSGLYMKRKKNCRKNFKNNISIFTAIVVVSNDSESTKQNIFEAGCRAFQIL